MLKICRFGIPKCKNSLHLVRSVGFSRQSSTLDQGSACFCHAWHGASGQRNPNNTSKCSYTLIHTIYCVYRYYMENWIPPHNLFLISRDLWVLVPPPSNFPGSQHWSLRFTLQIFCLIQRRKLIHWHSVARVTFPTTATLVLILTATRPSTAIWKPWVYSPGWAAKRLPDGKKNWSPHSIYRVTSTSGGRR